MCLSCALNCEPRSTRGGKQYTSLHSTHCDTSTQPGLTLRTPGHQACEGPSFSPQEGLHRSPHHTFPTGPKAQQQRRDAKGDVILLGVESTSRTRKTLLFWLLAPTPLRWSSAASSVISYLQASCIFILLLIQWVTEQGRRMAETQHKFIRVEGHLCRRWGFEVCFTQKLG